MVLPTIKAIPRPECAVIYSGAGTLTPNNDRRQAYFHQPFSVMNMNITRAVGIIVAGNNSRPESLGIPGIAPLVMALTSALYGM